MRKMLGLVGVAAIAVSAVGCGSNWRMHGEAPVAGAKPASENAPEWVQGKIPHEKDCISFVGRSHTPDMHKRTGSNGGTVDGRVGFTVMDERDAVQSARTDVYDQIRQLLQPRNVGTSGQTVAMNIDSGTCADCGTVVGMARTGTSACNDPCYSSPSNPWQTSSRKSGSCGSCGDAQISAFPAGTACAGSSSEAGAPVTLVDALNRSHRSADFLPTVGGDLARDLNLVNIGIDSVMPALLAQLQEREVYFEKWNVHEGDDPFARPLAEGRDEWQSYKCWVLYSIPRAEFQKIAAEFRARYEDLYKKAIEWASNDRERRMEWEKQILATQLKWQEQEREWNREDEIIARDHAITLDKDREALPGRRFKVVGSER